MSFKYTPILIIGFLLIIAVASEELRISNYRQLLLENPDQDLIFITNITNRYELLGRAVRPDVEFFRWKYQDDEIKYYFGRDLVDTSYWQLFEGSTGVWWKDEDIYSYWDRDHVVVVYNFTYFHNPQHTVVAGNLVRSVEIYPELNKETVIWTPVDDRRYNLKWVHLTDYYPDEQIDLDEEYPEGIFKNPKGLRIDWSDSVDLISQARHYQNGKVEVRYASKVGEQRIDPEIGTYKKSDYLKLIETKVDLFWAYTEYEMCNPLELLRSSDIDIEWKGDKNYVEDRKIEVFESYYLIVPIPVYEEYLYCREKYKNETKTEKFDQRFIESPRHNESEICEYKQRVIGETNRVINKTRWVEYEKIPLSTNECIRIRLYADLKPRLGERKIEHVPSVFGYEYPEYDWWNVTWTKKMGIEVNTTNPQWNRQYSMNITYDDDMNSDFSDLRFVNSTEDGELYAWNESTKPSNSVLAWVNVTEETNTTIYVYYGNAAA